MRRSSALTIGLVLSAALGVLDIAGLAGLFVDAAPPAAVVIVSALLGVVTIVGLPAAWRGNRRATVVVAATRAVSALLSIPAFFAAQAPGWANIVAAVTIAATAAAVALLWTGTRTRAGVA